LLYGTTNRAELGEFPDVRAEAARIVRELRPMGPTNVQLRIANGKPTCFELNIRFSGTTSIRARFGWNDVELALRHFVLNEPSYKLPELTDGIALRYWDEMCIDPRAAARLTAEGNLDNPRDYKLAEEGCEARS
jgi:carbamoyl-phosphate synthase large subunit